MNIRNNTLSYVRALGDIIVFNPEGCIKIFRVCIRRREPKSKTAAILILSQFWSFVGSNSVLTELNKYLHV